MPYRPAPLLYQSGLSVSDTVAAADFPKTQLRFRNQRAAQSVGLDDLNDDEWIAHFAHFISLPDNQPEALALRYHGHQFRQYNPDLGDGRGFLFAQIYDDQNRLLDLGTKGSGTTPWSRRGDGRLTLKGGVREVLATAMLEALGVPTSKSFSLIETGEQLMRGDEPSPTRSAVLVRLSHSHMRFGTFERLAYYGDTDTMRGLTDFIIANYYPTCTDAAQMFDAVVSNTAHLAARWMAAGFVHGVLNTDNMNITGESFDYGPYRFLSAYDPNFTAAYFDTSGLYAFGRQPDTVVWNLSQLGRSLTAITQPEPLIESLNACGQRYEQAFELAICQRLNILPQSDNQPLLKALFVLLAQLKDAGSFEGLFYDWFGGSVRKDHAQNCPRAASYIGEAFDEFYNILKTYSCAAPSKLAHPRLAEDHPETLLIDEIEAIWEPIAAHDDWSAFEAKLERIDIYRRALALGA